MSETRWTLAFLGVALVLTIAAWVTAPGTRPPAIFEGRGEAFFPEFTDPNAASSLEVVEFDEETSVARPFKVVNRDGRWTIPSHDDYPADGADRLSSIAAAVIALRKDDVAADGASAHERLGVIDPLDETLPGTSGRGTRITVRGRNERVLADLIAGRPVAGRPHLRYVRVAGQSRVYVTAAGDLRISTRFEDWIERNLLLVDRGEIDQVVIRPYSADPKAGIVADAETLTLRSRDGDVWAADGLAAGETVDPFTANLLVTKLVDLAIADVRPKPPSVAASLRQGQGSARLTSNDVTELASRGFYFTTDGRLLSNQGEVLVHTSRGIFYALRFGEVAYGVGSGPDHQSAHRYLFISVGLDTAVRGGNVAEDVRARLDLLRSRFAPWYYVVSEDDFSKIRLTRSALIRRSEGSPSR